MSGSRTRVGTSWRKPATRVYDYNYNLGEHYYKPQLKHMEQKHIGRAGSPPKAKSFAERFAEDPVYGYGPHTWRPASSASGSSLPRRSSLKDDYSGLRTPSGGDLFSPSTDERGRLRFSLGDRLLDSVGVGKSVSPGPRGATSFGRRTSPSPRATGGTNLPSPGVLDDQFTDPFFQRSKKFGRSEGPQSADADFMSEDPFKSRSFRGIDYADDMMDDMKLEAESQVARFRSKLRAKKAQDELLESGGSDDFGSGLVESRADRIRSRAKARLAELELDDEFPSLSIRSGRANDSLSLGSRLMNDMDSASSGTANKSIRISKRSIRTTVEN